MLEALLEYRTDGLILLSPRMRTGEMAAAVGSAPAVVVGRVVRDGAFDCVLNDEALGARLAVRHLVELGHERIVHIDGGQGAGAALRRAGYLRAMQEVGLERQAAVIPGDFTDEAGVRGAEQLLRARSCPPRCSPPTTSSPPGCSIAWRTRGCACPTTCRSWATTTRSWPRFTTCR